MYCASPGVCSGLLSSTARNKPFCPAIRCQHTPTTVAGGGAHSCYREEPREAELLGTDRHVVPSAE